MSNLRNTTRYSSTISKLFVVFDTCSKLKSKPIKRSELSNLLVGGSQRKKTNLLRKFCNIGVSKHWYMANNLVNNVWLRSVVRRRSVSNVLSATKNSKGKAI